MIVLMMSSLIALASSEKIEFIIGFGVGSAVLYIYTHFSLNQQKKWYNALHDYLAYKIRREREK